MDSPTVDNSDSDSGESWTLLENSPTYGEEAPDMLSENAHSPTAREEHVDHHSDKDEDTDGISIISDSEPESTHCDFNYLNISTEEPPAEQEETPLLTSPQIGTDRLPLVEETDFLGDNVKCKTYVHKRNPKVGSILDIIMLGTFVITAGMALGHLWSCKNECTTQTSVNKILSNLYKLQEENAFLRNKLKEMTEATGYQPTQPRKPASNKPNKQIRCKKIFEEPIMKNNNVETAIKCVDDNKPDIILQDSLAVPQYEKDFLSDVDKMKDIYDQNKDWLDKEVKRQFDELLQTNKVAMHNKQLNLEQQVDPTVIPPDLNQPNVVQDTKIDTDKVKTHKQINLKKQVGPTYYELPLEIAHDDSNTEFTNIDSEKLENAPPIKHLLEKKITYADSLKIDQPLLRSKRNENEADSGTWYKERVAKRKHKDEDVLLNLSSISEDDIKKDNRYTGHKTKYDKKKQDRQKSHKRQKRNNKYEQWEMKGGYLKDFDEVSVASSQDNDSIKKPEKKFLNADFENYVNTLIEPESNASKMERSKSTKNTGNGPEKSDRGVSKSERRKKAKAKESDWFEQRAALRAEARIKLEQELFGDNASNTAGWYFRRVQKREQCRAQKDNSTFKKFSKRKMNFKMKR